MFQMVSYLLCI